MPESNLFQPGQKFGNGRFVLVHCLGRGGMGEVWLARDERLHESVALKFLPPEIRGDPVSLDWLRTETVRSHKLSHANIVRIHDLHEDADGTTFIAMEYVDGPTLAALRLEQPNRVFHWDYLRPLLEQLCAALDYAHGEKVIHRDLKPGNMMVDGRGRLKLADFGLAAVVSDSISRVSKHHSTGGTIHYMSPQQVSGKRPETANDIYALGATLYELLTSQTPFYTGDLTHQVLNEQPEPMQERLAALDIQNEIPPDVAALVMACLAKDPAQRPQSALAVAEWIGLEVGRKPSLKSLSKDVSSGAADHATEIESLPKAKSREFKRFLWLAGVIAAVLLLALAGVLWSKRAKHAKTPSTASHTEPAVAAIDWIPLFNGLTLSGWTAPDRGEWKVGQDGSIISKGPRSLLYSPNTYTNLEFKAEIKMAPAANGGMFFRTAISPGKVAGYEAQAANAGDPSRKTGSLYKFQDVSEELVPDDTWFTQQVIAVGNRIVIMLNNQLVVDYEDPDRTYTSGHLALQQQAPGRLMMYRNVMVKPLPADENAAWAEARKDMTHPPK